ncbi:two-component sensor kinase [Escherichia coli]|nr:two-component sensor kinase [Escherichia coli]
MRAWRGHPGEEKVWHTRDAILLCIGHNTGSEKLVRAAARLASRLGSVWHAVYVETPALHRLPEKKRRAILSALRLAQELGAETATLSDPAEEKAVVRYAREHNLARLFSVARPRAAGGVGKRLLTDWRASPPISIRCWSRLMNHPPARLTTRRIAALLKTSGGYRFRDAWLPPRLCAVITLIAMQWLMAFDAANLVMLYLLGVVVVALFYGRWPSVVATVINVVSFDLFFIAPRARSLSLMCNIC